MLRPQAPGEKVLGAARRQFRIRHRQRDLEKVRLVVVRDRHFESLDVVRHTIELLPSDHRLSVHSDDAVADPQVLQVLEFPDALLLDGLDVRGADVGHVEAVQSVRVADDDDHLVGDGGAQLLEGHPPRDHVTHLDVRAVEGRVLPDLQPHRVEHSQDRKAKRLHHLARRNRDLVVEHNNVSYFDLRAELGALALHHVAVQLDLAGARDDLEPAEPQQVGQHALAVERGDVHESLLRLGVQLADLHGPRLLPLAPVSAASTSPASAGYAFGLPVALDQKLHIP
mmetsp:Transcript_20438/g.54165  ORF Transcript_20438/g.54165 Transcript_20438/m.54165 type:complete len:283 (-) Transcript_20438:1776-2624(-)